MKKFSKINESKIWSRDELEEKLSKIPDIEYKIINNYFFDKSDRGYINLINKISDVTTESKYVTIILIDPKIKKESFALKDWNSPPFNFTDSGFYRFTSNKESFSKFETIFKFVLELEDSDVSVAFKDSKIILYLVEDNVSKFDIDASIRMKEVLKQLYDKLKLIPYLGTIYSNQFNSLRINVSKVKNYDEIVRIEKTLSPQILNKPGYSFMKEYEDISELEDIRDDVNSEGFLIYMVVDKYDSNYYDIILKEFSEY